MTETLAALVSNPAMALTWAAVVAVLATTYRQQTKEINHER